MKANSFVGNPYYDIILSLNQAYSKTWNTTEERLKTCSESVYQLMFKNQECILKTKNVNVYVYNMNIYCYLKAHIFQVVLELFEAVITRDVWGDNIKLVHVSR